MILFHKDAKLTTTELGRYGEQAAADYLKKQGYRLIQKNFRAGRNEIDLIVENKTDIVFVEVKTRSADRAYGDTYGVPSRAVTHEKRKRTIAAARAYLYQYGCQKDPRFDVVEVYITQGGLTLTPKVQKIEHLPDAFRN